MFGNHKLTDSEAEIFESRLREYLASIDNVSIELDRDPGWIEETTNPTPGSLTWNKLYTYEVTISSSEDDEVISVGFDENPEMEKYLAEKAKSVSDQYWLA